jgi:Transposase DDE domain
VSKKSKAAQQRRQEQTFLGSLRKFLTPELYKQAHKANKSRHRDQRWTLQPLLLTLLTLTWCTGDSQAERFETGRAFCIACAPKRRRPGKTVQGFNKALARLPLRVLRVFSAGLRTTFLSVFSPVLSVQGWQPFGCDGSRLACPRSQELEQRLGKAGKEGTAPMIWVTAFVHLPTGLLWSWWLGKGDASERFHLLQLLQTLPALALVITDAGYTGFEVATAMARAQAQVSFLIRISSTVRLYTLEEKPLEKWQEGEVYYWPDEEQKQARPPLKVRLIRAHNPRCKKPVWLLTNVLDTQKLSLEMASKFYKMRWENEGFFRTYKRTLGKVKLHSRCVRLAHREAEGSLLAVQLLLAQGALGMLPLARSRCAMSSPRLVLREIRREIQDCIRGRQRRTYRQRLSKTQRERRERTSEKEKRVWPGRKPHQPPGEPNLLTMTPEQKALLEKVLPAA